MRIRTLPPPARLLFFVTLAGGVAAAAVRVADVTRLDRSDLLALVGLAAAILVTELFSVPLRLRTETLNFMLTDAAYIAGLILVRPSVLTFAVVAGVFAGQLLKRWDVRKVAFNVGVYLVGITAAQLIVRAIAGSAPLATREPRTGVAAVAGMAAFAVANVILVSGIIALVERKSFAKVVAPTLGLEAAHRAGN